MKNIKHCLLLSLILALLNVSSVALAQHTDQGLDQAIRSVEQRTGGRVLSAEKRRSNSGLKYRVKVLTPSGKVRVINVDAR